MRGESTVEATGGVTIETKEAPLIFLEANSHKTNSVSERPHTHMFLYRHAHRGFIKLAVNRYLVFSYDS